MKRIAAILIALLLAALLSFSAAAEHAGLTAECDSELKENRLFYVDVLCAKPVKSLQINVQFEASQVGFNSASSAFDDASFRYTDHDGGAKLIWISDSASSGKLFTMCFKSLSAGSSSIVIETVEAVGENLTYFEDGAVITFDVSVGEKTVTLRERERTEPTERKARPARRKDPARRSTIDEATPTQPVLPATVSEFDLRPKNTFPFRMVLCLVLLAGVFLCIGVLIGKRKKN